MARNSLEKINERISKAMPAPVLTPRAYNIKTLNGELAPWRLRPRTIPVPEESKAIIKTVRNCKSSLPVEDWVGFLLGTQQLVLPGGSSHILELQAEVHSTAFLRWDFAAMEESFIKLKVTYSEGYELEPRLYPFFRTKADRLDAQNGHIIGPYDDVSMTLAAGQKTTYEPFWFRTFRVLRLEIEVGPGAVQLLSFGATQVNYPLAVKASWSQTEDAHAEKIWEVSIRTIRNCLFDGYSDCPFYEQLQ